MRADTMRNGYVPESNLKRQAGIETAVSSAHIG